MGSELLVRTASALVLGAIVLVVTWVGGLSFRLLAVGIMALVFFEWFRIVQTRSLSHKVWLVGAATLVTMSVMLVFGLGVIALPFMLAGAALAAIVRRFEGQDLWPSVGILYAGVFGLCFVGLRDGGESGFAALILLLAIIWCTDIFAFFGGQTIGGPKLAPAISPKKTWSGFISGLAGGTIAGLVTASVFGSPDYIWIALISVILSLSGQLGDLFESAVKRRYNVKDSGHLIPGHGGVMDRVDSIIFAAFTAYIIQLLVPGDRLVQGGGNGLAYQLFGS